MSERTYQLETMTQADREHIVAHAGAYKEDVLYLLSPTNPEGLAWHGGYCNWAVDPAHESYIFLMQPIQTRTKSLYEEHYVFKYEGELYFLAVGRKEKDQLTFDKAPEKPIGEDFERAFIKAFNVFGRYGQGQSYEKDWMSVLGRPSFKDGGVVMGDDAQAFERGEGERVYRLKNMTQADRERVVRQAGQYKKDVLYLQEPKAPLGIPWCSGAANWAIDTEHDSYIFLMPPPRVRLDSYDEEHYGFKYEGELYFLAIGARKSVNQVTFDKTPKRPVDDDFKEAFIEALKVFGRYGQGQSLQGDWMSLVDPVF